MSRSRVGDRRPAPPPSSEPRSLRGPLPVVGPALEAAAAPGVVVVEPDESESVDEGFNISSKPPSLLSSLLPPVAEGEAAEA